MTRKCFATEGEERKRNDCKGFIELVADDRGLRGHVVPSVPDNLSTIQRVRLLTLSVSTDKSFELIAAGQAGELSFHRIDAREIVPDIMITAPLMREEPEIPSDIGLSGAGAAEVNDGGQILF